MNAGKPLTIVSQNEKILSLMQRIEKIAPSDSSVLLVGETGVGKEVFADYIHRYSHRRDKPFVKVGLAAMPADLLESELFGHEKGAFTSAHAEKKGLFEIADGGSIFLDDIDDVPMPIQSKLLRVLESGELMRVGATRPIRVDVRLITASKIDLKLLIERDKFRSDLFYRLNVVPMHIPPLRERSDDVPRLMNYFLENYGNGKPLPVTPRAMSALQRYSWPGNVRELRNVAQRLALFAEKEIDVKDLPAEIAHSGGLDVLLKKCQTCFYEDAMSFSQVMACLEANLLKQALAANQFNQSQAARHLKMSLSTFRDKLKKHSILLSDSL